MVCSSVASSEVATSETQDKALLERARSENTIAAFTDFIRRHPGSAMVEEAVVGVIRILYQEFPSTKYTWGIPQHSLEPHLRAAIRENRPLVIAFAPKEVERRDFCQWTTYFVELAGVAVRVDDMAPSIRTPSDGTWRAKGASFNEPLHLEPFGKAEHTWSCASGTWPDSEVVLTYFGSYGEEERPLAVQSYTRFPCRSSSGSRLASRP